MRNLQKLVDSVTMVDTAPKMIDIKYFSRCLNKTEELLERNECGGLRIDNVIEFEVVLKVRKFHNNSTIAILAPLIHGSIVFRLWNVPIIQRIGIKLSISNLEV